MLGLGPVLRPFYPQLRGGVKPRLRRCRESPRYRTRIRWAHRPV